MSIGNAVSAAATIAAGDPDMFFSILPGAVEAVLDLQAQYSIKDALPGSTVVEQPAAPAALPAAPAAPAAGVPVVPVAAAPVAPVAAPAIPGATPSGGGGADAAAKAEALWREFFENPGVWSDVRASKSKPGSPDFKHTTKKNEKGYYLALWIGGQYPAPAWAVEQLRAIGVQGV